jgi:hypothetical protein
MRRLFVVSIIVLTGCASTQLQGRVVSCADQKPVEGATLKVREVSGLNSAMQGNAPISASGDLVTKADGSFTLDMLGAASPSYAVTAEKKGFTPVESPVQSGKPASMCMVPAK